jgi:hypothetical protein
MYIKWKKQLCGSSNISKNIHESQVIYEHKFF